GTRNARTAFCAPYRVSFTDTDPKLTRVFGPRPEPTAGLYWFIISNGIPPVGRKVTFVTGFGLCPAIGRKQKARTSVARIMAASIIAKPAPMQTRGPPPNGRKA